MPDFDFTLRILIVDDSATMRRILAQTLKDAGFINITAAEDGKDAWDIIGSSQIDVVVSDHKMPGMSGIELLQRIRSSADHSDLPFIMVTAEGDRENVMQAVKMKVDGYVVKPFSAKQFLARFLRVLTLVQSKTS